MQIGLTALLIFSIAHAGTGDYVKKRNEYIKKEEENRNVLGQLFELQKTLKQVDAEKGRLLSKKAVVEKKIEKLNPLVKSAEEHLLIQKIELQKRLIYISKFQDMSLLKIMFSSQTPSELDRNLRILKGFTERDYAAIKKYFSGVKALFAKKQELAKEESRVVQLQEEVSKKETSILEQTKRKESLLVEVKNKKKNLLTQLKKIRGQETKSGEDLKKQEFLSTILEPLFFERKGELESPIRGKVVQGFGYFHHPIYKTQNRHKGIFIKPKYASNIQAIAAGHVIYLKQTPMVGYTMIVDHGDHYYSVYSYISEPVVQQNDKVLEGEILARGVSQHPFLGSGLYYELRHFSEPEDPQQWIEAKRGLL